MNIGEKIIFQMHIIIFRNKCYNNKKLMKNLLRIIGIDSI